MPRVLSLLQPRDPDIGAILTAGAADLLTASPMQPWSITTLLLGNAHDERQAADLGLRTTDRIAPPAAKPWRSITAVRRLLRRTPAPDLIHAWSPSTGTLATLAAPSVPRVITLNLNPASTAQAHWLSVLCRTAPGSTTVLALSNSVKRAWVQSGLSPDRIQVIHPGINMQRLAHTERESVRHSWGIDDAKTCIVALIGQRAACCDARRAAHILAAAHLSGLDTAMVYPPGAAHHRAAHAIARGAGCEHRLIPEPLMDQPWRILPAVDVALFLGDDSEQAARKNDAASHRRAGIVDRWRDLAGRPSRSANPMTAAPMPGILPLHWAAAAGRAIIADASYAVLESMEPNQSALLVTPGDDLAIVERLRQLRADRQLDWSIRDRARSDAFSLFSSLRFARDLATLWQQVVDEKPRHVEPIPLTGGLRFARSS